MAGMKTTPIARRNRSRTSRPAAPTVPSTGRKGPLPLIAAVGYLRRSTDRQEQSISDQRTAIERYAEEHGIRILRHYIDDGISGTSTAGRRAFNKLIADAKKPARDFALVLVYDVKRFGRVDNDEAGYYRHILRSHGVEVRYASENFVGDGSDDLLRPVKQWQARQESMDLAKVSIRGLVSKAKAQGGFWMGGAPPYGYDLRYESSTGEFIFSVRYQRDGSKLLLDAKSKAIRTLPRGETIAVSKRDRCRLLPGDPQRVEAVKRIFTLYAEDRLGYKAIADRLNREGVPTARSKEWAAQYSGRWSIAAVRAILTNPAYVGELVWNRRTDARFFRITGSGDTARRDGVTGRRLEPNDRGDWITVKDAHEPLVDRRLWLRAEAIRTGKPSSREQRGINPRTGLPAGRPDFVGPRTRFLLSGLVRCSACGSTYEGRQDRARPRADGSRGEPILGYACGGYIRQGRSVCTRGFIRREPLEAAVLAAVNDVYAVYAKPKSGERALRSALERILKAESTALATSRSDIEARLEKIDGTIRNLLDNITAANRAMVDKRLGELGIERAEQERELDRIEALEASRAGLDSAQKDARMFLRELPVLFASSDPEQRQAALRRSVASVTLDRAKGDVHVAVRMVPSCGPLPENLPTATRCISVRTRASG